jgi:ammonia channel protein AmtB
MATRFIGMVVAFVWAFGLAWLFFKAVDMIIGMRTPADQEPAGLDIPEPAIESDLLFRIRGPLLYPGRVAYDL